jgi:hypothetical protein
VRRLGRPRETNPKRTRDRRAAFVHVDELDVATEHLARQPCGKRPDRSGSHNGNAVTSTDIRIPDTIHRGLEIRRQYRALRRHIVREQVNRVRRDQIARLMRIQDEHGAIAQLNRSLFDDANAGVAVLHRRGKVADLKRRAHSLMLRLRDAAVEDECLRATADPAVERPHDDIVIRRDGQRLVADFAAAGSRDPERLRRREHDCSFWCTDRRSYNPAHEGHTAECPALKDTKKEFSRRDSSVAFS